MIANHVFRLENHNILILLNLFLSKDKLTEMQNSGELLPNFGGNCITKSPLKLKRGAKNKFVIYLFLVPHRTALQ